MDEYNGLILVRHKEDMITEQFQYLSLQEQQDYIGAVIKRFTRPEQMDEMFAEGINSKNVEYEIS